MSKTAQNFICNLCETRDSKYPTSSCERWILKYLNIVNYSSKTASKEIWRFPIFSKCNTNQCLKVLFIFSIQMAIRTRLVSKSHSMFGFAICICCDTFCFWLVPVVWRSVKLIKFWQQDKSWKPLRHFLPCLLWWYLYSSGSN